MAFTRPRWASLMTSWTPSRPRSRRSPQELSPERLSLAVTSRAAQYFPSAVGTHAGRDHDSLGHDPLVDPDLAVGRVQEHVGERDVLQRAAAPDRDVGVELCADPGDLAAADAGAAHRDHQVVDPAGADAFDVGLHHDRVQRHVDPAARAQQGREERTGAELRDLHREVPDTGRDDLVAGPVALGRAGVGPLVQAGADVLGGFRVDHGLEHASQESAHQLTAVGGAEHLDHLEQGRIV